MPYRLKAKPISIRQLNLKLANLCKHAGIDFLSYDALWMHVGRSGEIDNGLIQPDDIHLRPAGLGRFLKGVKSFFKLTVRHNRSYSNDNNDLRNNFNSKNGYASQRLFYNSNTDRSQISASYDDNNMIFRNKYSTPGSYRNALIQSGSNLKSMY